jgi:hypothetical protein
MGNWRPLPSPKSPLTLGRRSEEYGLCTGCLVSRIVANKQLIHFLEDDDGPRQQTALAVDLGADILADRSPPNVAARDEWCDLSAVMQFLFEADPLEKAVHVANYSTWLKGNDLGDGVLQKTRNRCSLILFT